MQAVIFHVGPERFAIDTRSIVEVIPGVAARPIPAAHEALVGVIDYRGHVVPVLDLCRLFGRGDCPVRMSNRILMCDVASSGAASDEDEGRREPELLGVLAEDVTRVAVLDPEAAGTHPGPETPGVGGLGRILRDGGGLLQLVEVGEIIPPDVLASLRRAAQGSAP